MLSTLADMPDEDLDSASDVQSNAGAAAPAPATEAEAALALMLRTSCTIIDMGSYLLSECPNTAYTADEAALPCIAGKHVRQILPEALVERAALFPAFDPSRQVTRHCNADASVPRATTPAASAQEDNDS